SSTDGNITLSANQQATPTSGDFSGVTINHAILQSTGAGNITIQGKGGTTGNAFNGINRGVSIVSGGAVLSGTGGIVITAIGGNTLANGTGLSLQDSGSTISTNGGNIQITGTGGGNSSNASTCHGVSVLSATISSGGNGTVNIVGLGGIAT